MKIKKELLVLVFFVLLGTNLFYNCSFANKEPAVEQIPFISQNVSDYVIIRPDKAEDAIITAAQQLRKGVLEATGVGILIKSDYVKSADQIDASAKEILIGETNRPESAELYEKLGDEGYALQITGNKIVIAATHNMYFNKAVEDFVENYIKGQFKDGNLYLPGSVEKVEAMNLVVNLIRNGKPQYTLVYPGGGGNDVMHVIDTFNRKLDQKTHVKLRVVPDWAEPGTNTNEIIVGLANRPESQEITATLGYTDYAVKVVDKKIIISSYSAEGLKLAFDDILQKIRLVEIGDDTIWQISDDITTQNKISGWPAGLPIFAKGTASVYKTSDTIYEVNVKGTTAADYTSYLSELTKIGYTKYTENRIGVNTFATYTKDKTVVHIYYLPNKETTKIIVEPLGYLPATAAAAYQKVVDSSITQIKRTFDKYDNGLCLIVQLEDGSFIIVDSGNSNANDMTRLYEFLKSNTPGGGKPVIAAWFFTHPHGDHLALGLQFLREYRDQVVIELFAYNFADYSAVARANDVSSESSYMSLINDLKSVITANYPNAKKFTFHTGQRLYLRNAYVDIYYTHEDLYPTNVDYGNNTSAAFKINVSGTDIMILGDADTPCSNFMEKVYGSAMKSEILQPSHHGYNGGTLELYKLIAPKVCLWACPTDIFEKGKVNNFEYNLYLKQTAKEHYASDYTTTIKLPYQG